MAQQISPDAETSALTAVDETHPGAPAGEPPAAETDSSATQTGVTLSKPKNF